MDLVAVVLCDLKNLKIPWGSEEYSPKTFLLDFRKITVPENLL